MRSRGQPVVMTSRTPAHAAMGSIGWSHPATGGCAPLASSSQVARRWHRSPWLDGIEEVVMGGSLNMVGYGLSAIGPGVGIGLIFAAFISGTARQPEAEGRLQTIAILGVVVVAALAISGIALGIVL